MARTQTRDTNIGTHNPNHQICPGRAFTLVSTHNNQDPEMQLSELRQYTAHRGWEIVEEYTDEGVSGCKNRGRIKIALWLMRAAAALTPFRLEDRSFWEVIETSHQLPRRTGRSGSFICQPAGSSRSEYTIW